MQRWFTDPISLQIMMTVSELALKWMLSIPFFWFRVPCSKIVVPRTSRCPDSLYFGRISDDFRSQLPLGLLVCHLSYVQVFSDPGPTKTV